MPFAYFDRLSAPRKRVYLRSDAIEAVVLPAGESLDPVLVRIEAALPLGRRAEVERASRELLAALSSRLSVPPVEVHVKVVRPSGTWGELHGLYEPAEAGRAARISTWMRTVARRQPVAYKSFVRTLLHELCHHLDYELYGLPETFHTEGFYKRETSLFRQLHGLPPAAGRATSPP